MFSSHYLRSFLKKYLVFEKLESVMSCPICSSHMEACFQAKVLHKHLAQYEVCNSCGFLRAKDPYWLEEAYNKAIANADTGIIRRNVILANKISRVLYWLTPERGRAKYLDVAGGYGILTRMMRDVGFDYYWSDKYCENLVASGFEHSDSVGNCAAVTAIEVFEHLVDPKAFILDALNKSGASTLIFTTELYEGNPPKPDEWWYYTFATGQHIGFFQRRTLEKLADDADLNFASANGLHILSKHKIKEVTLALLTNSYLSLFPTFLIAKTLGSKTIIDHKHMLQKLKG